MFIVFEGIDGCGKSTQAKMLKESMEAGGLEVVIVQNPGSTQLGMTLRGILLGNNMPLTPAAEALLFAAGTAQLANLIHTELTAGKIVICDRWIMTGLAYQGHGRGRNLNSIRAAHCPEVLALQPNITFVLDLDVMDAAARVGKSKERFESAGLDFFERVRAGFLVESVGNKQAFKHNAVMLNGALPVEQLYGQITTAVRTALNAADYIHDHEAFVANIESMMEELPYRLDGTPKEGNDDDAPAGDEPVAAVPSIGPEDVEKTQGAVGRPGMDPIGSDK